MNTETQYSKYIIVKRDEHAPEHALLFPRYLTHADMLPHEVVAVAAGVWAIMPDGRVCVLASGSVSLNLPARPQDGEIIERTLARNN